MKPINEKYEILSFVPDVVEIVYFIYWSYGKVSEYTLWCCCGANRIRSIHVETRTLNHSNGLSRHRNSICMEITNTSVTKYMEEKTLIVKKEKYNQLTYLCLCQTTYLLTNKTQKTFAKCEIHFYWQQSIGRHSERTNERNFRRCTFQR